MTDWFERLTGFAERDYAATRQRLWVADGRLHSRVNDASWRIGMLELPSLAELRRGAAEARRGQTGRLEVRAVRADVRQLHADPANEGALFQVASQFNLLEMTGPEVTPEDGVTRYAFDATQGPACAIAAGAATIYRNYFADVKGQIGQTASCQIDALHDLGLALGNADGTLWTLRNGYAMCSREGLRAIGQRLATADAGEADRLRGLLRIGVHRDVEVSAGPAPGPIVSQAFCSALPVSYSRIAAPHWEPFARLILEAAYEATLCAALVHSGRGGSRRVYLTMLGGGAFGNDSAWILDALRRALALFRDVALDVRVVSRAAPSSDLCALVEGFA